MRFHRACVDAFLDGEAPCLLCELELDTIGASLPPDEDDEEEDAGVATTGTEDTPGILPTPTV